MAPMLLDYIFSPSRQGEDLLLGMLEKLLNNHFEMK